MSNKKFNIGDKVKYIGDDHNDIPEFYPSRGTFGIVISQLNEYDDVYVQWEKGSTSKEDCWYCDKNDVELVRDEDMTNEEIWEMLLPKLRKNGFRPCGSRQLFTGGIANVYAWEDVHNAITLAYRVGYMRSQKGRPFKFGEKKKNGGYWEPVDPNNLPKEGTKVRYSRFIKQPLIVTTDDILPVGSIGIVKYFYNNFGIEVNEKWYCSSKYPKRLDMWVEDNE